MLHLLATGFGPFRHFAAVQQSVAIEGIADIKRGYLAAEPRTAVLSMRSTTIFVADAPEANR